MLDAARSEENESTSLVPDIAQSQHRLAVDRPETSSVTAIPSRHWYVAHTHVHAETKATFHLGRQGFEVYLPRYTKRRRHARRVDTVAAPLFPRYLFVAVDTATQRWHSIRSTIGITKLVTNGDVPAVVPETIIEGLRRREDANGFVQLERRPRFASGDKIRVREGAFCDALGLFDGITGQERVAILLDLLGRKVRVVLGMDVIEAA
jgi:transcriptional antiterminator RfaH